MPSFAKKDWRNHKKCYLSYQTVWPKFQYTPIDSPLQNIFLLHAYNWRITTHIDYLLVSFRVSDVTRQRIDWNTSTE